MILIAIMKVWLPGSAVSSWQGWNWLVEGITTVLEGKPRVGAAQAVRKGTYQAMVIDVHDGDTIRVRDQDGQVHKIRLSNIDAPELKQAYGIASRDALSKRINGQSVVVNVVNIDRYQREVGQINLQQDDINLWMVRQGYAWHYKSIAKKQQNKLVYKTYRLGQSLARQQKKGLWQQSSPQAPWKFRHSAHSHSFSDNT